MVKVTLERVICDLCDREGERYTISYPDGMKVLDRCDKHNKGLMKLKDEAGEWTQLSTRTRGKLQVLTPEQIRAQRKNGGNGEW